MIPPQTQAESSSSIDAPTPTAEALAAAGKKALQDANGEAGALADGDGDATGPGFSLVAGPAVASGPNGGVGAAIQPTFEYNGKVYSTEIKGSIMTVRKPGTKSTSGDYEVDASVDRQGGLCGKGYALGDGGAGKYDSVGLKSFWARVGCGREFGGLTVESSLGWEGDFWLGGKANMLSPDIYADYARKFGKRKRIKIEGSVDYEDDLRDVSDYWMKSTFSAKYALNKRFDVGADYANDFYSQPDTGYPKDTWEGVFGVTYHR
jgi:hypothetical protein